MQNSSITNIGFISWSLLKSMSTIYQKGWQLVIRQRTANNNTQIGANQMETDWLSTTETVSGASSSTGMLEIEVMMSSFPKHSLTCPHSYTERSLHFTKCSKKTLFFRTQRKKNVCFAKYSYLCVYGLKLPPTPVFASQASFTPYQILLCMHMQVTDTVNSAYTVSCDYTVFLSITSWLTPSHMHTIIKPTQRNTLSNTHTYNESSRDPPLGPNQ